MHFFKLTNNDFSSDEELLRKYKAFDENKYIATLYDRYLDQVYGVSLKYLKSREDSQDAVIEIFELILKKLQSHNVSHFKPWLYTVSRNYCLEKLRKNKKTMADKNEFHSLQSSSLFHPDEIDNENLIEKLEVCLERLPQLQKKCIQLFYFRKNSYKQISNCLSVNWKSVRSALQNGRRNLKICLELDT